MKFKVVYDKRHMNIGGELMFINYFLSVDEPIKISVEWEKDKFLNICVTSFVIRVLEESGNKIFHDFKMSYDGMDTGYITYNDMRRLFIDNYVIPNKEELIINIDRALNKYMIEQSL